MSWLSDEDLERFRAGDGELFEQLVETHSARLLAFVRPFANDLDEAHDLLQEPWRRVFEKRHQYRGDGTLIGWCLAVCRTICHAARARCGGSDILPSPAADLAASGSDPEGSTQLNELRRHIAEALMDLPPRERDVVILRMLEQRSTRETAQQLGCAEGTRQGGS